MESKIKKQIYDYSKLKGRIIEKFGSQKAFAEACGFAENTISKKLSGQMAVTTADIENWSSPELLAIPAIDYPDYYFKKKED